MEARDGVNPEGLIVPFSDLARAHDQAGEHALAIAALDRALELVRVNRGVYSLDQAPLLRQGMIDEEASGNLLAESAAPMSYVTEMSSCWLAFTKSRVRRTRRSDRGYLFRNPSASYTPPNGRHAANPTAKSI
ncbi:MAG TPA: hypothetical protein VFJ95_16545 [Gammaproteobacteria bacterium]|nr:hypothetical protein [Gammaproteobacteria bacterium]